MRKLSLALLLVGCQPEIVPSNHRAINGNSNARGSDTIAFEKTEYEGHTYIIVSGFHFSGLEHDPDCPCKKVVAE